MMDGPLSPGIHPLISLDVNNYCLFVIADLTLVLPNCFFLFFYFSSFEVGIADAISSFKWQKIPYLWNIDISKINLLDELHICHKLFYHF